MVFLKEIFENVDFEKISSERETTKEHIKTSGHVKRFTKTVMSVSLCGTMSTLAVDFLISTCCTQTGKTLISFDRFEYKRVKAVTFWSELSKLTVQTLILRYPILQSLILMDLKWILKISV